MTAKFGQARRRAFLAALGETGNQSLAAERAKVSRSWVSLHRKTDPAFREACDRAVEEAKAVLRQAQYQRGFGCKPPSGWGFLDGEELVVKGTGGSALASAASVMRGPGRRVQVARARLKQWTPRVEERFLTALTATCNVRAACAEVGLTPASAYNHRRRWVRFAERWDEAVEAGFVQIEMGLVEAGCNLFSSREPADVGPIRAMTAELAIQLLHMHKRRVEGSGKRPGRRARPVDIEVIREEIERKVDAMQRGDSARLERDRAEWDKRSHRSS